MTKRRILFSITAFNSQAERPPQSGLLEFQATRRLNIGDEAVIPKPFMLELGEEPVIREMEQDDGATWAWLVWEHYEGGLREWTAFTISDVQESTDPQALFDAAYNNLTRVDPELLLPLPEAPATVAQAIEAEAEAREQADQALAQGLAGKADTAALGTAAGQDVEAFASAEQGDAAESARLEQTVGRLSEEQLNTTIGAVLAASVPLDILRARLAKVTTEPVRIAFTGSSTTAGSNATAPEMRYVDRLVATIQGAYPAAGGAESSVIASTSADFGTLSTAVGVHGYNAGEGGTSSSNYLTATERTKIAALSPAMVMHMVFANDYRLGVPVATAKANLIAVLDDLRSKLTAPCAQVLVNSYPRFDSAAESGKVAPWSEYGKAMREVAAMYADAVYIDLAPAYVLVGIPGVDPLNLIDTDDIHQTDQGHAFMADLLRTSLSIPGGAQGGGSSTTTIYVVTSPSGEGTGPMVFSSDSLSGGNAETLVGRSTDATLGGTAKVIEGSTTDAGYAISAGTIVPGATAASQFVGLSLPSEDQFIRAKVIAKPAAGSTPLQLDVRRLSVGANTFAYRLSLTSTTMALRKVVNGSASNLATGIAYAVGDTVEIRAVGTTVSVLVNGTVVQSVTDSTVSDHTVAGLARTSTAASFALDDIVWGIVL